MSNIIAIPVENFMAMQFNSVQLQAYYLRNYSNDTYLIPESEIQNFDYLSELISDDDLLNSTAENEFNDKYSRYIVEGNLYSTKLYINENIFDK